MNLQGTPSLVGLAHKAVVSLTLVLSLVPGCASAAVSFVGRIELPDTQGRLDHLAIDEDHGLLSVAALGANAVDTIDLKANKRVSHLKGLRGPQGLMYVPSPQRLWVANGDGGNVELFLGDRREGEVAGLPDADNLRLDVQAHRLYIGYGSALAVMDTNAIRVLDRIALPGHPEAFELSAHGPEVYVNVPTAGAVVVVDRRTGKMTAKWDVAPASRNFPMALDESKRRLFIATRSPAALEVFDTSSGRRVAQLALCGDADDLFVDGERRALYAVCGEGHVAVVSLPEGDHSDVIQRIETSPGARTGLFVPAMRTLFVAAPSHGGRPAAVLIYRIE